MSYSVFNVYPCCHEVYLVIVSIHIRCEILHGHIMGVGGGGGGWGRGEGVLILY